MSLRILAFSDLHLNRESDFTVDPLLNDIERRSEEEQINAILTLGDVVDNIPRDREQGKSDPEEDIRTGRSFFSGLDTIHSRYNIPTLAVPGNHDYDIFDQIISDTDGDSFDGVYDARGPNTLTPGEVTYGVVGAGIDQFDIGPEVDPDKYGIEDINRLTESMYHLATVGDSIEQSAESLGIAVEDYPEFYEDSERFLENFRNIEESFEAIYDEVDAEQTIFMSHIAPFNTELDAKSIGRDHSDHQGSLATRAAIDHFMPGLALNGHHDYHEIDYFPSDENYGSDMYAIGIDEATPTEIVFGDGTVGIEQR